MVMDEMGPTAGLKAIEEGGGFLRNFLTPWWTKRQSSADAQRAIELALAGRVNDLMARGELPPEIYDMLIESGGTKGFVNLVAIVKRADEILQGSADATNIGESFATRWKERARLASDDEMRTLWAQMLAGEAITPGAFSKQAINVLDSMSSEDARKLERLCQFVLQEGTPRAFKQDINAPDGTPIPIFEKTRTARWVVITSLTDSIYQDNGISVREVAQLESLGLIQTFSGASPFQAGYALGKSDVTLWHKTGPLVLKSEGAIGVGKVLLTECGQQITALCDYETPSGFVEHIRQYWVSRNTEVSETVDVKIKDE